MSRRAMLLLGVLLAAAGCNDPVHDDAVASLGPEDPNVPPGPLHRPGQPCMVCHDGTGPAALAFATAGTIFQDGTNPTPLVSATVQITDINDKTMSPETNCAGNFFVEAVDFDLVYPLHAQVFYGSQNVQMLSHIAKTGGCADCHLSPTVATKLGLTVDPQASTGQIYMNFATPCSATAPCPSGFGCLNSVCLQGCAVATDCESGFICADGVCQYPPSGCSQ